jgi:EAL domain-containing protein (putative c-di-GMP-specific phosphodiesterase class I)
MTRKGTRFDFPITMAFQPIFDLHTGMVFAQEALVRGIDGASAASVLSKVNEVNRYAFDQTCRVRAIERATEAGVQSNLSINFMPNAIYQPDKCIRTTLMAAERHAFPLDRIIFEFLESEAIVDVPRIIEIIKEYRAHGFMTAIDDFGAGVAGFNYLIDIEPDIIKLDRHLVMSLDTDQRRRAVVRAMVTMCAEMGCILVAEGIETSDELRAARDCGVRYAQGFALARPSLQALITRVPAGVLAEGLQIY